MASPDDREESIFETLRRQDDAEAQAAKASLVSEKERLLYAKEQKLSGIRITGTQHTRKAFLRRIISPIFKANQDQPYTLSEIVREASIAIDKLRQHDIFHPHFGIFLEKPPQINSTSTPTDIAIHLSLKEKPRLLLKTGTDVGNSEGSAYGNVLLRNIFGGAETLNFNAALGTRTRSAYQATFQTPFLANPYFVGEIGGLASSTQKPWASHEEVTKGAWAKLRWLARGGRHELGYSGAWRQLTGLASNASPTVRGDAGDSLKSSITYSLTNDRRDYPLLPEKGFYSKTSLELAGWGLLQGDVGFGKAEIEGQGAIPIPVPGIKGRSGVSFTTGVRAGLLYPLPIGFDSKPAPSRLNDRFQLGGPTDVRGFRLGGLGPRDGSDAVGGDVYAAGSANLLFPLPRVGVEKPFRFQTFVNGGRLLALKTWQVEKDQVEKGNTLQKSVAETITEIGNGLPSLSAGIGLVYAHPVARFELNFSLPLVIRKGEDARKGLQFGVGINML
ncbi:MAG: hypothetical protein LQ342_007344 [Letrouitia transgressa]|nr:MAG: hypothetical protein LQ342_007344 [Letrouitia transgressa]